MQSEVSHTHHHHPDLSRPILCQWPVNSPPHSPLKQTKLPNMIHMFVYYFTCYASMSYKNKLILCETYIHASSRMGFSPLLFCFHLFGNNIHSRFIYFFMYFPNEGDRGNKIGCKIISSYKCRCVHENQPSSVYKSITNN